MEKYEEWMEERPRQEEKFVAQKLKMINPRLDIIWLPSCIWDLYIIFNYRPSLLEYDYHFIGPNPQISKPYKYENFMRWLIGKHAGLLKKTHYTQGFSPNEFEYLEILNDILSPLSIYPKKAQVFMQGHKKNALAREQFALHTCSPEQCKSLLISSIRVELESRETNKVPIFRYTRGINVNDKEVYVSDDRNDPSRRSWISRLFIPKRRDFYYEIFDFPGLPSRLQVKSLSFSYSLLAGFIRDGGELCGACTFIYAQVGRSKTSFVYSLLLDRKWFYSDGHKYFYWPAVSLYHSPLLHGENFHPRTLQFVNYRFALHYPKWDFIVDRNWKMHRGCFDTKYRNAGLDNFIPDVKYRKPMRVDLIEGVTKFSVQLAQKIAESTKFIRIGLKEIFDDDENEAKTAMMNFKNYLTVYESSQ